ncbi:D-amino-acid transaminase [Planomicrobium sp. CPCC 101079]|uniref:D-amino-acid transaminase n=1 Tax=Planomicrobium sp. CPCC 101079 TaxID=2599618 RepID=UPI0011B7B985|nr:D-amino-acid transaminase [Planomicrobium sp. CPCC 101079]TWT12493.1 D-amino-acid transaminase [Planomicrobium sp. CPCC 101079]
MDVILHNDQFIREEELVISKEDRGYQFGDGIYEVIRVYEGNLYTAKEHIDRFYASAEKIKIVIPYTKDVFHKLVYDLVEKNEINTGQVYVQITRGASVRQHHFPADTPPVLIGYTKSVERPVELMEAGVRATFIEDIRWLRCDIKSLNLLGNVLAKQEAHDRGFYEAILHRGEVVTEGSSTNMYGIKDGVVYTHPTDNLILPGITRSVILELCKKAGIQVQETAFTKSQALEMDEFFLSSTTAEVMPIIEIDGQPIGGGTPGPLTQKLQEAFTANLGLTVKA